MLFIVIVLEIFPSRFFSFSETLHIYVVKVTTNRHYVC